jgi:hypothetical protein
MYLPYVMQSVRYVQQQIDAGCGAMGRVVPAPARGTSRPAHPSRTHGGLATLLARGLANRVRSAKPRTAQLP